MPLATIVAPLPALKFTTWPDSGFPCASVTVAFTLLVADPFARASLVTLSSAPSTIRAVLVSAVNVTLTLWLLLLIDAVTVESPATVLVSVMVTVPSSPVVPLAAIVAPLPALKFTVWPDSGFPFASVTVAFTLLVADPFATASLVTLSSAPSAICAEPASAVKVTFTLSLLPLIDAVTVAAPATVLVSVMITLPSGPVVPLAAIVAPLSTLKFTTLSARGFPSSSVSVAFTLLGKTPSAMALSVTTMKFTEMADVTKVTGLRREDRAEPFTTGAIQASPAVLPDTVAT